MKFQIVATAENITETQLGSVLASIPDGMTVSVARMQDVKPAKRLTSQHKPRNKGLEGMIAKMPQSFHSKELIPVIEDHGHSAGSISHFIRQAIKTGLIKKVDGTAGNATLYEKIAR